MNCNVRAKQLVSGRGADVGEWRAAMKPGVLLQGSARQATEVTWTCIRPGGAASPCLQDNKTVE